MDNDYVNDFLKSLFELNTLGFAHSYTTNPKLHYDNAPGGYRQDLVSLKKLIPKEARAAAGTFADQYQDPILPNDNNKHQCFITVFSAFDVQQPLTNANLVQNFKQKFEDRILPTPFAAIFAPSGRNLKHVEVNVTMINFILRELPKGEHAAPSTLAATLNANETYNVANVARKNITTTTVNGVLKVNAAGAAGYGNEINTGGVSFTGTISKTTCANSMVSIANGGRMEIGEGSRIGIVKIQQGGILHVHTGG